MANLQNLQERKQLLTVADWAADFQSGFKVSNTAQTSDATSSAAVVTEITTSNTNEVPELSAEISSTNISTKSPITNVQETNSSVNNVKDEHENDLILVNAQSNVIDNSHKQESTDTVTVTLSKSSGDEEGKLTDFATFDNKMVSVETSDDSQKDVHKQNEKIQEKDLRTL